MNLGISLLLIVLLVFWFSGILRSMEDTCTQAEFNQMLDAGEISGAVVVQNREVPTGSVEVHLTSGDEMVQVVSDVNPVLEELEAAGETDEALSVFSSDEVPEFNDAPDEAMAAAENEQAGEIDLADNDKVINGVYTIRSAGDHKFTCSRETGNRIVVDGRNTSEPVSYTHLRAPETRHDHV